MAAVRATRARVIIEGLIDQFLRKQSAFVLGMARLTPLRTTRLLLIGGLGRLDDVGGRRLGRSRGVLARAGQLFLETRHGGLQRVQLDLLSLQLLLQALAA
jgi:hypothetical protein